MDIKVKTTDLRAIQLLADANPAQTFRKYDHLHSQPTPFTLRLTFRDRNENYWLTLMMDSRQAPQHSYAYNAWGNFERIEVDQRTWQWKRP